MRSRIGIAAIATATCFATFATTLDIAQAAPATAAASTSSRVREDDPLSALALEALADLATNGRGDPSAFASYEVKRNQIATEVANRLQIDPALMMSAWQHADIAHQTALMAAFTQLGVPYRRNTSKAGEGFDCSGLTTYAWGVAGVTLTRQSGVQIRNAAPRTQETAMAGDLLYYPGHVMLWLGVDTAIVHSPYTGRNVEVDMITKRRSAKFGNPIG